MKRDNLFKIINITLLLTIIFSSIYYRKIININISIVISIILFLLLILLNKIIRLKNIKNNRTNNIVLIIIYILVFSIINIFCIKNFNYSSKLIITNILLYIIIVLEKDIKITINSLLLTLIMIPLLNYSNMYALWLIMISIILCSFINKQNIERKYVLLISILIGIIVSICTFIDISSLFILLYIFLYLMKIDLSKKSFKLIMISLVSLLTTSILIYFFTNNSINLNIKFIFLFNSSIVNIINMLIIIFLLVINIHTVKLNNINKFMPLNFSILLISIFSIFYELNIYNYLPLIILLISNWLIDCDLKNYTNIYKEFNFKRKNKNIKKVSVVIPNYNYENYINERIDSVLLQTYPIYELIILDDKSTDNSVEVIKNKIEEIKNNYPNIKVDFIPNDINSGNVFKQWNKAFEVSTGDFLWIAEADDSCSNIFLQEIMKSFDDEKVIMSYSESLTMDENNKILMRDLREWIDIFRTKKWDQSFIDLGETYIKNNLSINNTIANVSSLVFRKLKNINYNKYLKEAEKFKLAGDWYFYEKILRYGKISYNNNSLNYHRMHGNSVTLTTTREKEYEEIVEIQNDIIKSYNLSGDIKQKIEERRTIFQGRYGFCDEELKLSKLNIKEIIEKSKIQDDILLSIIVPVYNTEKYIEKCLNSILVNLPEKTEIIVVNDGSPDNSEKIIKKIEKQYPNIIKYYKKDNGGLSNTKNFGLNKAKGRYIGFVDSDDYIKSTMFDCMIKKAIMTDADIVHCDVEMVYEDGSSRIVSSINNDRKDEFMQILDTPLMTASWSKIVKKELFENLDYPDGYNNEDIAVSPILFARSKKTVHINSAFYKYLQRSGSIQNSEFDEKRFVAFYTSKLCIERIKKFSKSIQEKIKGTLYTNQLLALLIYSISEIDDDTKRLKLIELFCNHMNEFDDYDKNKYVIEYMKSRNKLDILNLIKTNNYKKINKKIIKN